LGVRGRAPGDVVRSRGGAVLVDQLLDDLAGVVELVEVVLEDLLLAELLQERLALPQLVVLPARPLEELQGGGTQRNGTERIVNVHARSHLDKAVG